MPKWQRSFLLFDSGDDDRIIGFCSPTGMKILSICVQWHVDGTYKSSPKYYYQSFSIHSWYLDQMFPCLYVCLKEKSELIYKKMINLLRDA